MRTIEQTVYKINELKELNFKSYQRAIDKQREYVYSHWSNYWYEEIFNSLSELIEHAGYTIKNYSIGESNSHIRLNERRYYDDLYGKRAFAWLENQLLSQFRIKYGHNKRKQYIKYGSDYMPGNVKPCPFTGMCYDIDFIESLIDSLKSGMCIRDAMHALADTAQKIINAETSYRLSEKQIIKDIECNGYEFDENGNMI